MACGVLNGDEFDPEDITRTREVQRVLVYGRQPLSERIARWFLTWTIRRKAAA